MNLPDAAAYDVFNDFLAGLQAHDRKSAEATLSRLESRHPGHRLTLSASALASYDANTPALLHAVERLLEMFPDDSGLIVVEDPLPARTRPPRRAPKLLDHITAKPACEPVFFAVYSTELRADAREMEHNTYLSSRVAPPTDGCQSSCVSWADLLWDGRRFTDALGYYRLAARLEDKKENFSRSFFIASRHLRQTERADRSEPALRPLRETILSSAVTLAESLDHLERTPEAFLVLDRAIAARPDDGDLILFVAEFNARHADRMNPPVFSNAPTASVVAPTGCAPLRAGQSRNDRATAFAHWRGSSSRADLH